MVCLIDPVGDVYACPFAIHPSFLAGNVRGPGGFAAVWQQSELFADLRRPQSGVAAVRGVGAEHADLARRTYPEPLEDLDRGGLARAVRPEQGEHLPAARREADPAEHVGLAVPHPQITDSQYILHASEDSINVKHLLNSFCLTSPVRRYPLNAREP